MKSPYIVAPMFSNYARVWYAEVFRWIDGAGMFTTDDYPTRQEAVDAANEWVRTNGKVTP